MLIKLAIRLFYFIHPLIKLSEMRNEMSQKIISPLNFSKVAQQEDDRGQTVYPSFLLFEINK